MAIADFAQIFLLYLVAAACLPDNLQRDHDLAAFHARNRRYFWSVFSAYQASYAGLWLSVFCGRVNTVGVATAFDGFRVFAPLAVYLCLTVARHRLYQAIAPLAVAGLRGDLLEAAPRLSLPTGYRRAPQRGRSGEIWDRPDSGRRARLRTFVVRIARIT